ncbi:PREDICTED: zinc finger protein DZIP1L [Mesitornis unicolor]|uniref:zinc finger protein DZIP1L n=1 Tax=Mesitornis unicolor TaxID=54374 RepID=UPI000528BE82|nr:PREDICTED: zinc finger protein DZIP1L [Mesitornis unicolor]
MLGASLGLPIPVDTPAFCFQPRQSGVDWHRFSAINMERVAQEVDVAMLQEHIAAVTFCNLAGERCPHCRQPADPILLTVLRMAQLSTEYLLHCQERLGTSLAQLAQNLQGARAELACTQQLAVEQAAQLQRAKEESRRWKKLLATQQLLLQAGPNAYCKCHLCDKAFMDVSFLKTHVQCQHSEATEGGRQKTKALEQMEDEVKELKAKLQEVQQQLEAGREAGKLCREQETERARQQEKEGRKDLERWKEEETMKLCEEIDGLRQLFLVSFKDMASRNSAMEGLKKVNKTHHAAPSPDQQQVMDHAHEQKGVFSTHLREQLKVTKSQDKAAMTQEVTKVVVNEESSDGEEATLVGKWRLLEALQRNPNLLKQFCPVLEEVLEEKLESMGVKRVVKGISTRIYKSLQVLAKVQRQQRTEKFPDLLYLQDELLRAVMGKVRLCK